MGTSRITPSAPTGLTWDRLPVGWQIRTSGRTVFETDVINFVTTVGLLEAPFVDRRDSSLAGGRGVVPGVLTFALAEGLVNQSGMMRGTGHGFMGTEIKFLAPVLIGDTIEVDVEVIESRPRSSGNSGVVVTRNRVFNENDVLVMEYSPARLFAGPAVAL